MRLFIIYLLIINLISLILMGIDKSNAKRDVRRIPEKTLFFFAMIGGSVGANLSMYLFRHKTRNLHFVIGMPVILFLHLILGYLFL